MTTPATTKTLWAPRAATALLCTLLSSSWAHASALGAPCPALQEALAVAERDPRRTSEAAALLPPIVARRLSEEAGRTTATADTLALLRRAVHLRCPTTSTTTLTPSEASLAALVAADPRFGGLRVDRSLGDRLFEKIWSFVELLLESEGMQRFSEHTRTVYLSLLAAACAFVAFRIWRRHPLTTAGAADDSGAVVERRRREAFSALRAAAAAARGDDPRGAALLLRRALLSRVGEIDDGATSPARTSREVLARLPDDVVAVVTPALSIFDSTFYADAVDDDAVASLMAEVDRADVGLRERGPQPRGPGRRR